MNSKLWMTGKPEDGILNKKIKLEGLFCKTI
jgi:hypothetical protein